MQATRERKVVRLRHGIIKYVRSHTMNNLQQDKLEITVFRPTSPGRRHYRPAPNASATTFGTGQWKLRIERSDLDDNISQPHTVLHASSSAADSASIVPEVSHVCITEYQVRVPVPKVNISSTYNLSSQNICRRISVSKADGIFSHFWY